MTKHAEPVSMIDARLRESLAAESLSREELGGLLAVIQSLGMPLADLARRVSEQYADTDAPLGGLARQALARWEAGWTLLLEQHARETGGTA